MDGNDKKIERQLIKMFGFSFGKMETTRTGFIETDIISEVTMACMYRFCYTEECRLVNAVGGSRKICQIIFLKKVYTIWSKRSSG